MDRYITNDRSYGYIPKIIFRSLVDSGIPPGLLQGSLHEANQDPGPYHHPN